MTEDADIFISWDTEDPKVAWRHMWDLWGDLRARETVHLEWRPEVKRKKRLEPVDFDAFDDVKNLLESKLVNMWATAGFGAFLLKLNWFSTVSDHYSAAGGASIDLTCKRVKHLDPETLRFNPEGWIEEPQPFAEHVDTWLTLVDHILTVAKPAHMLVDATEKYFGSPLAESVIFHADPHAFLVDLRRILLWEEHGLHTANLHLPNPVEPPKSWRTDETHFWAEVWPDAESRITSLVQQIKSLPPVDCTESAFLDVMIDVSDSPDYRVELRDEGVLVFTEPFASLLPFFERLVQRLTGC